MTIDAMIKKVVSIEHARYLQSKKKVDAQKKVLLIESLLNDLQEMDNAVLHDAGVTDSTMFSQVLAVRWRARR